ncbi:MAG: DUF1152 domain-containing protein [Candidatus Helarchaeota archaeon]
MIRETPIGLDAILQSVQTVLISGIGGGGDVLTALHVRWALEKRAPHINWIHGGVTGSDLDHFENLIAIDENSAWVSSTSRGDPPHRLIEAVIAEYLDKQVFLLSCHDGVRAMVKSLNNFIQKYHIEALIYIDGGTDSLAFRNSSVRSPTEDTMGLAAVGLGTYSTELKYRIIGASVVGSDGEMTLAQVSQQFLKIYTAGGYIGGVFFPAERLQDYASLVNRVLDRYPTNTALAPLFITKTAFKKEELFYIPSLLNGFQLATFLFDAKIAAEVGNDFTKIIFEKPSRNSAREAIEEILFKNTSEK